MRAVADPEFIEGTCNLKAENGILYSKANFSTKTFCPFFFNFVLRIFRVGQIHWRIQGGHQGRAPPWGTDCFIFMQFRQKNCKIRG